ncbi:TIGR00341 family protein [Candidatus Falkowbacteria bacterium]|jgi:uncharacterized hydrophobic protein (TIGR00271 family)|nr:TIGR00341 family protein [Candidatus Falkowbacteria bacterium]MBT5502782.1 TIGR00341 family protein [Candidatus Falkowbacteria bacterium]MBT6573435.1 TIGR00341 family protein [Candidatus Falkowbacteria bacterium]MBT7348308.1 TIGR00341 family protein [Candidatus Falkowbacteria bacterium]MBT7501180.1 TIGR00341 family protein [Candidatus Falkowbacteria bacterium]
MQKVKKQEAQVLKRRFFKSFFIAGKRQIKVFEQINENAKGDFDFYVMTLFAGIIIALGIVIDSAAVVIGGMLLAPLVWPILGMALGVTMGRSHILRTSLMTILKSTLVIVIFSILVGLIAPEVVIESKEFLSRTQPTLLELLIALAAGFVGAFIIAYPKMGSAISGVVVAAAIVPPVATVGLSLARGEFDAAAGAFLLYLSNLIAITFAATILFLISNFSTSSAQAEEKRKSGFRWSLLLLIVIIVPLVLITKQTALTVKQSKAVKDVVVSSLQNVAVSSLKIDQKNDILVANLTVQAKEGITEDEVEAMENILTKRLKETVILNVTVVPTLEVGRKLSDLWKDDETPLVQEPVENLNELIKCPISIGNKKVIRSYSKLVGCPICPKIIICENGVEFAGQQYNEETGLCEDLLFAGGTPCFDESSPDELQQ